MFHGFQWHFSSRLLWDVAIPTPQFTRPCWNDDKPWYFVKETSGVIGFVGGAAPSPLRQAEVDEIRARIEAANGKEVPKVQYTEGEEVKVTDGAFTNLTGRIDEIDPDRGKLKISVSIFGRFTPVELEYWQVERITE